MRGLPGSGKSFWAWQLFGKNGDFVSTDSYFTDPVTNEYRFDPTKLGEYHDRCFREFIELLRERAPLVVVDNTNLKVFEIAPYVRVAQVMGYGVEIIHVLADPQKCIEMNTHGVPANTILQMQAEPLPYWWPVRTIMNV